MLHQGELRTRSLHEREDALRLVGRERAPVRRAGGGSIACESPHLTQYHERVPYRPEELGVPDEIDGLLRALLGITWSVAMG